MDQRIRLQIERCVKKAQEELDALKDNPYLGTTVKLPVFVIVGLIVGAKAGLRNDDWRKRNTKRCNI